MAAPVKVALGAVLVTVLIEDCVAEAGVVVFSLDDEELFLKTPDVGVASIKLSWIVVGSIVDIVSLASELDLFDSFVLVPSPISLLIVFLVLSVNVVVRVMSTSGAKVLEASILVVTSVISRSAVFVAEAEEETNVGILSVIESEHIFAFPVPEGSTIDIVASGM